MASTTVNFNLKTAGYVNYANQTLTFRLLTAGAEASTGDQSYVTLPGVVTATSAANGDGSVSLFRNGKSGIESVYEVILPNREKAQFIIPSGSATIELATLLVDHVPGGSNVQQSSVYAEAIKRANHTGTQLLSTISDAATVQLKPSEGAFVNGDKTKLTNIETAADVTDTANVTAAGALMDSECAGGDPTNVKALNQSVVSGAAPVFATTNMTDASDKRFMTNAQETKLDAINSEVTTLSLPASTTISTFAKTFLDDADATAVKSTLGIVDLAAVSNFVPNSITFTNTSTYLSLPDTGDHLDVGTGDFSLSFWARLDSNGTEPVLTKLSGTGYRLRFVSGNLILTMSDSGGSADLELATGLNDNKWHVYVVSIDRSGNATTYVDNVAQTPLRDVSGTALSLDNSGEFRIGSDGGSNAGDGIALGNYIALHKGSDGALTAAQASQIFFSADSALTLLNPVVAPSLMVDLRKADKTFTDLSTNALAVTTNGTIIFNEGRITSLDGVGDINCSSISADVAATGLNVIFDGTDTGDNKITLTDNLASALDITESTNSYLKFTTTNTGEKVVLGKDLDISGDHDLIIGTSTGTKIGTATTQKIGFFNATPVVQQSGVNEGTGFAAVGGTGVNDQSTFTGNVGSTAYRINDIVKALKNLGILAP